MEYETKHEKSFQLLAPRQMALNREQYVFSVEIVYVKIC
jgi:hypothetical protein